MGPHRTAAALATGLLLLAAPARAQFEPVPPEPEPVWEAGVAGGVASTATYVGSSRRDVYAAAFPYVAYRGPWLRVSGRSARVILRETPRYWIDLSGGGWFPVRQGDDSARAGMPDLDFTFQAGPRVNYLARSAPRRSILLRLAARGVWSAGAPNDISHRGFLVEPAARLSLRPGGPGGRLGFGVTLSTLLGDAEHNAYFYDVPAAYVTPTRPAYRSGWGPVSHGLTLTLSWRIGRGVSLGLFTQARTLEGTVVGDSPLVNDNLALAVGAGFNWVFWRSERTVAVPTESEE